MTFKNLKVRISQKQLRIISLLLPPIKPLFWANNFPQLRKYFMVFLKATQVIEPTIQYLSIQILLWKVFFVVI